MAECCQNEALRRCSKVNLVDVEPDILLAGARFEWENAGHKLKSEIDDYIKEEHVIGGISGRKLYNNAKTE